MDINKKRKEIREVIDLYADDGCMYIDKVCAAYRGDYCVSDEGSYKCLMLRLGELGCVLRADTGADLTGCCITRIESLIDEITG